MLPAPSLLLTPLAATARAAFLAVTLLRLSLPRLLALAWLSGLHLPAAAILVAAAAAVAIAVAVAAVGAQFAHEAG